MAEEVIHKLVLPIRGDGYLNGLILCWKEAGEPSPDEIRHTKFSVSINNTTCEECKKIWIS